MHDLSDAELVEAAGHGESEAFDVLFRRYYDEACDYSARFASPDVAAERVTVAFARIYRALLSGRHPESDFTTVVQSAVRGVHADVVRRGRKEFLVDEDELDTGEVEDDSRVRPAFASLSPSWRRVLWYTVVLEESDDVVAERLGLTPKQVASLWLRAREGLRRALLAAGLAAPADLGDVLTPSLVLEVPGTTAGDATSDGVLAGFLTRLPDARQAAVGVAAVAVLAIAAVLGVAALTSGTDDESPVADPRTSSGPPQTETSQLPSSGQSTEREDRTEKPSKSPTSKSPTASETITPTTPTVAPPTEQPPPTETSSSPSPSVSLQGASSSGSGLLRVAKVTYAITPLSADSVVVTASNARFISVTGAGVLCSGQSVSGGQGVVTCRVVQGSDFSLSIRVTYADPGEPVSGAVSLTGADQVVSDGFTVAAD